ncbi:hypothetical protein [Agromyces humi]|uniref:hypothetical protein n=1 Tax=Agromyces humi TaxID=1766800 RepID=UPI001356914F|nr:hypothetical protein [Agromyces humi]
MTWSDWEAIGPTLFDPSRDTPPPALASRLPNQIDIFRIANNELDYANDDWQSGPRWDRLHWMGMPLQPEHTGKLRGVSASASGAGNLWVAVNFNSRLRYCTFDGHGWSDWKDSNDVIKDRPAVSALDGETTMIVNWRDDNRYVWMKQNPNGAWSEGAVGDRLFYGPPTLISDGKDWILFGKGEDKGIWVNRYRTYTDEWVGWTSLGGNNMAGWEVAATSRGLGKYEVFYAAKDLRITWGVWEFEQWSGWEAHPSETKYVPFAVSHTDGTIDLYHYGTDGNLYRRLWR